MILSAQQYGACCRRKLQGSVREFDTVVRRDVCRKAPLLARGLIHPVARGRLGSVLRPRLGRQSARHPGEPAELQSPAAVEAITVHTPCTKGKLRLGVK